MKIIVVAGPPCCGVNELVHELCVQGYSEAERGESMLHLEKLGPCLERPRLRGLVFNGLHVEARIEGRIGHAQFDILAGVLEEHRAQIVLAVPPWPSALEEWMNAPGATKQISFDDYRALYYKYAAAAIGSAWRKYMIFDRTRHTAASFATALKVLQPATEEIAK